MDQTQIEAVIRKSVGSLTTVTFGGHTETVLVVSVDPDGFICRLLSVDQKASETEFWLAYSEVSGVTTP